MQSYQFGDNRKIYIEQLVFYEDINRYKIAADYYSNQRKLEQAIKNLEEREKIDKINDERKTTSTAASTIRSREFTTFCIPISAPKKRASSLDFSDLHCKIFQDLLPDDQSSNK